MLSLGFIKLLFVSSSYFSYEMDWSHNDTEGSECSFDTEQMISRQCHWAVKKNEGMIFTAVFVLGRHYSVTVVWIFRAVVDGKETKEDFQQETKNPWRLLWNKCQNEHLKTDGENKAANECGQSWSLRFFFCMWMILSIDIKGFPRRCRKFWKKTNVCALSRKTSTCLHLHRKPESKASVCCSSDVSVASLAFCYRTNKEQVSNSKAIW